MRQMRGGEEVDGKEEKESLQRIAESLERIATSLEVLARCGKAMKRTIREVGKNPFNC